MILPRHFLLNQNNLQERLARAIAAAGRSCKRWLFSGFLKVFLDKAQQGFVECLPRIIVLIDE